MSPGGPPAPGRLIAPGAAPARARQSADAAGPGAAAESARRSRPAAAEDPVERPSRLTRYGRVGKALRRRMTSWRTRSRATVCALVVAVAALVLAPSWQGDGAWSATAMRRVHARAAAPAVLAESEADLESDHRAACAPCPGVVTPVAPGSGGGLVGRLPGAAETTSGPRIDVQSRALRAPPQA